MPAAKSLNQHVTDRTFRARRHHALLAGATVEWPTLALLQSAYNSTGSFLEQRAVAVEFEREIRKLSNDPDELAERARQVEDLETILFAEPASLDLDSDAAIL